MGKNTRPNKRQSLTGGPKWPSKYAAKVAERAETGQVGSSWVSGYDELAQRELSEGEQLGVVVHVLPLKGCFFCQPHGTRSREESVYVNLAHAKLEFMPVIGTHVAMRSKQGMLGLSASTLRVLE